MIVCAAVLGQTVSLGRSILLCSAKGYNAGRAWYRNSLWWFQNNPLYLEAFQNKARPEDALKFHYIVHCALDAVEEKGMACFAVQYQPTCQCH